jgi:hypothetical protein
LLVSEPAGAEPPRLLKSLKESCKRLDGADHYRRLDALGVVYDPAFRCVTEVQRRSDMALSRLELSAADMTADHYMLHPVVADAVFQTAFALVDYDASGDVLWPVELDELKLIARLPHVCYALVETAAAPDAGADGYLLNAYLLNEDGEALVVFEGLRMRHIRTAQASGNLAVAG